MGGQKDAVSLKDDLVRNKQCTRDAVFVLPRQSTFISKRHFHIDQSRATWQQQLEFICASNNASSLHKHLHLNTFSHFCSLKMFKGLHTVICKDTYKLTCALPLNVVNVLQADITNIWLKWFTKQMFNFLFLVS